MEAAIRRSGKQIRLIHVTVARAAQGEGTRDTTQGCVAAAVHQWGTRAVQTAESVTAIGPAFRTHREGRTQFMQTITMETTVRPVILRQPTPPTIT
eukprot:2276024-Prorocentrum_lima.AAC.1